MNYLIVCSLNKCRINVTKGNYTSVDKPAENVTACCSAIPTSKALDGIFSIMNFNDDPDGMAGVIPTIFLFFLLVQLWFFQKHLDI